MGPPSIAAPDGPAPVMTTTTTAAAAAPAPGSQAGRFICAICSQCFQRKNGLSRHMRSHTGEKPFACSYCHFKSTRTDSLQRHMKLHLHTASNAPNPPTTLTAALATAATSVASATQAQPAPAPDALTPSRPTVLPPQSPPQGPPQTLFPLPPPPPPYYPLPPPPPPVGPDPAPTAPATTTPYQPPQPLPHSQPHSHHHQHASPHVRHHPYYVPQPRRYGPRTPSPPAYDLRPTNDAAEVLTRLANASPTSSDSEQDSLRDAALLQSIGRPPTPDLPIVTHQEGLIRTGSLAGFLPSVHDDDVDFSRLLDRSLDDETNLGFAKFVQSALTALAPALAVEARSDDAMPEPEFAHALHALATAAEKETPLGTEQIHAFAMHFSPSLPFIHRTFLSSAMDRPVGLGITTHPEDRAGGEHPFSGIGSREEQDLLWAIALVGAQYTSPPPRAHGLAALKASLAQSLAHDSSVLGVDPRMRRREPLRQAQALVLVSLLSLFSGGEEAHNHARLFHAAAVSVARNLSLLPEVEGDDWSSWIMRIERRRTLWAIWVCDLLQVIFLPARPWLTEVDPASLSSEDQWFASHAHAWHKAAGHQPAPSAVGLSPALGLGRLALAPPQPIRTAPGSPRAFADAGWEGQVSNLLSLVAYTTIECSRDWDTRATLLVDKEASDDLTNDLTALDDRASQTIAQVHQALRMLPPPTRGLASPAFRDLCLTLLNQLETRLHTMRETDPLRLLARVSHGVPSPAKPRGIQSVLSFLGGGWTVLFPPSC